MVAMWKWALVARVGAVEVMIHMNTNDSKWVVAGSKCLGVIQCVIGGSKCLIIQCIVVASKGLVVIQCIDVGSKCLVVIQCPGVWPECFSSNVYTFVYCVCSVHVVYAIIA